VQEVDPSRSALRGGGENCCVEQQAVDESSWHQRASPRDPKLKMTFKII
jgi:hypothetical protein